MGRIGNSERNISYITNEALPYLSSAFNIKIRVNRKGRMKVQI